jgi:hypothetical protein
MFGSALDWWTFTMQCDELAKSMVGQEPFECAN